MEDEGLGGGFEPKTQYLFLLVDCSGSMAQDHGSKISSLNNAMREALPALAVTAPSNGVRLLVRVLAVSTGVRWHVAEPTPVERLRWVDLQAGGHTDFGAAFAELARVLRELELESSGSTFAPPAVVVVSDGHPTDDVDQGLGVLLATPWGAAAARLAVAIGDDADVASLARFVGDPEVPVLTAYDPEALSRLMRWATTVAVQRGTRTPRSTVGAKLPPTLPAWPEPDRHEVRS